MIMVFLGVFRDMHSLKEIVCSTVRCKYIYAKLQIFDNEKGA